jgi:hypothetical protein
VNARRTNPGWKLQGFIDDLTSVLGLQSALSVCRRDDILRKLGDTLLGIADLRFVLIRLRAGADDTRHDLLSLDCRYSDRCCEAALIAALEPWLLRHPSSTSSLSYTPIGPEALSIIALESGSNSASGRLVAGAAHGSLPSDLERILLRAAANHAWSPPP